MKNKVIAVLAFALIAAMSCGVALAYSGDVTLFSVKAYSDAAMTQYVGTIPAGTALLVRSYDSYADVYIDGKVCYVDEDALLKDDLSYDYVATLSKGTKVYQRATTSAKSCKVKSDITVKVCAVSGEWAMVQTTGDKGLYGFAKIEKLDNIRLK